MKNDIDTSVVDDWLPFKCSLNVDNLKSHRTITKVVPEVPDLDYIVGRIRYWQKFHYEN
jgi:hypothetical protein